MSEPIRTSRKDTAPTPQNTPASASTVPSSASRTQPMASIDESNALGAFANNPALLSLIQGKLGTLAGQSSGLIDSLPAAVRTRIAGLKGLSAQNSEIEAEFQRELLELEKKFYAKQKPLYELRAKIIAGETEPEQAVVTKGQELLDEEKELFDEEEEDDDDDEEDSDEEEQEQDDEEHKDSSEKQADGTEQEANVSGIPDFWLVALKNVGDIADIISERDDEVLHHLQDIQLQFLDKPGFALKFIFGDNPFFTNKVLTKTYYYQDEIGPTGDFVYDHAEGTDIRWTSPEANVTVVVEKRKQRNKHTKATRTVERAVPVDSFFSFFSPPQPPSEEGGEDEYDEDVRDELEMDFDIGELIKVKLIPRAIDWYTGRALEYEGLTQHEDEFADEGEDESDGSGDDEDGSDEDENASKEAPQECKQQ